MADRRGEPTRGAVREDPTVATRPDRPIRVEPKRGDPNQVRTASGLNALLGLWLMASPWILGYEGEAAAWNALLVGAAILILGAIRAFGAYSAAWMSWVNVVLGIWLIISPFVLATTQEATWNFIIVGIIVAVLGAWSAMASRKSPDEQTVR